MDEWLEVWSGCFASFPKGEQVGEKAVGTRDAGGELAEESNPRVHVVSLAMASDKQAPLEGSLAWIIHREERRIVLFVPFAGEIRPALLHPVVEIGRADLVRSVHGRMVWAEQNDGR